MDVGSLPAPTPSPVPSPVPGGTPRPGGSPGGTTGVPVSGGSTLPVRRKAAGGAGRFLTPWGRRLRSPSVCRILDLRWLESEWPKARVDGYAKSLAPLSHILTTKCFDPYCVDLHCKHLHCKNPGCAVGRRPAIVYIYDPAERRETKLERERKLFGDDDIVASTNFFHLFSIPATEADKVAYRNEFGKTLPALIFLAPDGHTVTVLEGRLDRRRLVRALDQAFKECLGWKRSALVRHYGRLLKEIERYEDKVAAIGLRFKVLDARVRSHPKDQRAKDQKERVQRKLKEAQAKLAVVERKRVSLLRPDLLHGMDSETTK